MKDKRSKPRPKIGVRFFVTCAMILIVAGAIVAVAMTQPSPEAPIVPSALATAGIPAVPVTNPAAPVGSPAPYQYDAVNDRHWDPRPGHNHWHNGPPPSPLPEAPTPVTATPGTVQAPWSYDAANDRHWDPRPGHNHWHNGPPPPPEQRQ